jgi:predicted ribonuclease YlaK
MPKIVFLDTNIYLHYQDIDQIDWLKVVQADAVIIVVPPITIRELNKHKDSHSMARVRKRAGAILKKLSELFGSSLQAQLKSCVAIHLEDSYSLIDFGAHHLSREIQDDNLIASIIMYRNEMPDTEIILATTDAGLTLLLSFA